MIAIRMVFAHPEGAFGPHQGGEPFIVPLAIPLIAGPSALATVMLMATREPGKIGMWAAALAVTMTLATLILVTGDRLQRWLGDRAMQAAERLMGLILTAIAVEMLLGGVREFVEGLK
jgi:small neutral amino acid transporter SnatA (MarC family)